MQVQISGTTGLFEEEKDMFYFDSTRAETLATLWVDVDRHLTDCANLGCFIRVLPVLSAVVPVQLVCEACLDKKESDQNISVENIADALLEHLGSQFWANLGAGRTQLDFPIADFRLVMAPLSMSSW